jgi:predicted nuclease of predicted toxin-antitoxin system
MEIKFIVDSNAGKLARWLRMMGYDALFFNNIDDAELIDIALKEGRVVLTKDTQLMRRRVVTNGQLKIVLIQNDDPKEQLRQVVDELKLDCRLKQLGAQEQRRGARTRATLCLPHPDTIYAMPRLSPGLLAGDPLAKDEERAGRIGGRLKITPEFHHP